MFKGLEPLLKMSTDDLDVSGEIDRHHTDEHEKNSPAKASIV